MEIPKSRKEKIGKKKTSIHLFSQAYGSVLQQQSRKKKVYPPWHFPSNALLLLPGDPRLSPSQTGDEILPVCSGSSLGSSPVGLRLGFLHREASWWDSFLLIGGSSGPILQADWTFASSSPFVEGGSFLQPQATSRLDMQPLVFL